MGSETESKIRAQATAILDAFVQQQFDTYADFTYPEAIKFSGGRQEFLYNTQDEIDLLAKHKMKVISHKILSISDPIKAGDELHSIVKYLIRLSSPGGKVFSSEYFIASSNDGGTRWEFVNGSLLSQTTADNIFPSFNAALELPDTPASSVRLDREDRSRNKQEFINLKAYLKLPKEAQKFYTAGLTDAFMYLSEKTGYMEGLDKCFFDNRVTAPIVAKAIETAIESWVKEHPRKPIDVAKLYARTYQDICSKFVK